MSVTEYDYIIEKIINSEIKSYPFDHLEIEDFLSEDHLNLLLTNKQIHFEEIYNDIELYKKLISNGYKIQSFPGCVNTWEEYNKNNISSSTETTETKGITFRLKEYENERIQNLLFFLNSKMFQNTLEKKFNISNDSTTIISAIQKNLNGYEISPHPDIRQKALTYLLNINKNEEVENYNIHTHLLEFKSEYKKIEKFWEENKEYNRFWVPWDYCTTVKKINKNNTLLIFKPSSKPSSLHAVKLNYDHLKFQRTQIYGNLMYTNCPWSQTINYNDI